MKQSLEGKAFHRYLRQDRILHFIYVIRKYSGTPGNSYGIKRKLTQIFTDLRIETSCNQ